MSMIRRFLLSIFLGGCAVLASAQAPAPARGGQPAGRQHNGRRGGHARGGSNRPIFSSTWSIRSSSCSMCARARTPSPLRHRRAFSLVGAVLLRRILVTFVFGFLKRLAGTHRNDASTTKLFPALEAPAGAFVMVTGIFAALKVLKLYQSSDHYLDGGSTVGFSLVLFWGLLRGFDAVLDHAQEIALPAQPGSGRIHAVDQEDPGHAFRDLRRADGGAEPRLRREGPARRPRDRRPGVRPRGAGHAGEPVRLDCRGHRTSPSNWARPSRSARTRARSRTSACAPPSCGRPAAT